MATRPPGSLHPRRRLSLDVESLESRQLLDRTPTPLLPLPSPEWVPALQESAPPPAPVAGYVPANPTPTTATVSTAGMDVYPEPIGDTYGGTEPRPAEPRSAGAGRRGTLVSPETDPLASSPPTVGFREALRSYRSEDLSPQTGNALDAAPETVRPFRAYIFSATASDTTGGEPAWTLRAFDLSRATAGPELPAGDGLRVLRVERTPPGNAFDAASEMVPTFRAYVSSPAGDVTGGERAWTLRAFDLSEATAGPDLPAGDGLRVFRTERAPLDRLGDELFRTVGDNAAGGFLERVTSRAALAASVDLRVADNLLPKLAQFRAFVRTGDATATDGEATPPRASETAAARTLPAAEGPAVAPVSAAAVERQAVRVADVTGSALADRAAVSAALVSATDRRAADNPTAVVAIPGTVVSLVPGVYVYGAGDVAAAFRRPVYGAEPTPPSQEQTAGNGRVAFPETKFGGGAEPTPAPEAADLLTNTLPFSLAALERAIQALTEPEAETTGSGPALWYWLGLSSWLLASAFAYEVARRRRAAPDVADVTPFGEPGLLPEGLS
jgi:hypothetical protein